MKSKTNISTKGALTLITGVTFEQGLATLKETIELMSGEPANEITIVHGERLDLCKSSITKCIPSIQKYATREINRSNYLDVLQDAIKEFGETVLVNKI